MNETQINFNNCSQCLICFDIISSLHSHHMVWCKCRLTHIDGGDDICKSKGGFSEAIFYINNQEELDEAYVRKANKTDINRDNILPMVDDVKRMNYDDFSRKWKEFSSILLERVHEKRKDFVLSES